ncbi:Myosin-B/C [Bienertia sinuspersici]
MLWGNLKFDKLFDWTVKTVNG